MTIVGGETSHGLGAFFGLCSGNCFSGSASGSTPYLAGTLPGQLLWVGAAPLSIASAALPTASAALQVISPALQVISPAFRLSRG